jgi:integrase
VHSDLDRHPAPPTPPRAATNPATEHPTSPNTHPTSPYRSIEAKPLKSITEDDIEAWFEAFTKNAKNGKPLSPTTRRKVMIILKGIFKAACKRYKLPVNPVADVEMPPQVDEMDVVFFSPAEVRALRAAAEDEQDGAIYLTAAFTGLRRGELIALRWRDVKFGGDTISAGRSYAGGEEGSTKSGKVRSVPMVEDVSQELARLSMRKEYTGDDDLVFPGEKGGFMDGSALRRRYIAALKRAELRQLRFHDLRHTFGSLAINILSIVEVQAAMGHADITTTQRYLHNKSRGDEAKRLGKAFAAEEVSEPVAA